MLLSTLVATSARVADTRRRLVKIDLLAGLLGQLAGDEIETVVAFLSGGARQGRIGVGWATIRDAGAAPATEPSLEIREVDAGLDTLSKVRGAGSEGRRRDLLHSLFGRATEAEQRFLTGLLMGEIRQGALEGMLIEALAKAARMDAERVRRAVMLAGDVGRVARAALLPDAGGLEQFDVRLFRPVQPMLAATAEDVSGALGDLGEAAFEYKFDGVRIQVHRSGGDVMVFSRALNDVTAAVPEIVEAARALPGRDLILDGEALSLTPEGRPQPFQVTMRRFGRKLDLERMRAELPLTPFWFDVLYVDGQAVIDEPQARRFSTLAGLTQQTVPHTVTGDPERAAEFLREALDRGHEGIMAKALDAPYAAGSRGQSWLKVKRARTLDLAVLAAEWGHGRRHGWLSNLHLGAREPEKGGFAMLGKTFKGLTDEMLAWQTEQLLKLEVARDANTVYVEPKLIVEIAFNDVQVSPHYPSGMALRFARVKRYRTDKSEADTLDAVRQFGGHL